MAPATIVAPPGQAGRVEGLDFTAGMSWMVSVSNRVTSRMPRRPSIRAETVSTPVWSDGGDETDPRDGDASSAHPSYSSVTSPTSLARGTMPSSSAARRTAAASRRLWSAGDDQRRGLAGSVADENASPNRRRAGVTRDILPRREPASNTRPRVDVARKLPPAIRERRQGGLGRGADGEEAVACDRSGSPSTSQADPAECVSVGAAGRGAACRQRAANPLAGIIVRGQHGAVSCLEAWRPAGGRRSRAAAPVLDRSGTGD